MLLCMLICPLPSNHLHPDIWAVCNPITPKIENIRHWNGGFYCVGKDLVMVLHEGWSVTLRGGRKLEASSRDMYWVCSVAAAVAVGPAIDVMSQHQPQLAACISQQDMPASCISC